MAIESGGAPAQAAGGRPTHQGTGTDQVLPGGRRICGRCGSKRFKEENDKTKPLSFTPPFLYAKKFICKDCGKLFTGDEQQAAQVQPVQQQQPVVAQPVAVQMGTSTGWETDSSSGVQVQSINQASTTQPSSFFGGDSWSHQPLPGGAPAGSEYAGVEVAKPDSGRDVCPQCGGTAFNLVEDRSQPISFGSGGMGTMYKKEKVCKRCGTTLQE
jgi:ribosomal protein S27AE